MLNQKVFSLAAATVACTLLAVALWAAPFMSMTAAILAAWFGVWTLTTVVTQAIGRPRSRDPYDLRLLRQIDDEGADAVPTEEEAGEYSFNRAICRGCGEEYDMRLPVCPRCKRSQY